MTLTLNHSSSDLPEGCTAGIVVEYLHFILAYYVDVSVSTLRVYVHVCVCVCVLCLVYLVSVYTYACINVLIYYLNKVTGVWLAHWLHPINQCVHHHTFLSTHPTLVHSLPSSFCSAGWWVQRG